jgi:hypothetical protein
MSTILSIRDETVGGEKWPEWSLEVLTERITVRELIRSRVYQEVQDFNAKQPQPFRGLIQPTDAEATLNGYRLRTPRLIDWKSQFEKAITAFNKQQILILLNERQVESLDEEIEVKPGTKVTFLRLAMLVGG